MVDNGDSLPIINLCNKPTKPTPVIALATIKEAKL